MGLTITAAEIEQFVDMLRTGPEVTFHLDLSNGNRWQIGRIKLLENESVGGAFVSAVHRYPQPLLQADKITAKEIQFLESMLRDGCRILAISGGKSTMLIAYDFSIGKFIGEPPVLHYFGFDEKCQHDFTSSISD